MPLLRLLLTVVLLAAPHSIQGAEPHDAAADRPLRILFAGSSSTYWNDLPGEVAKTVSRQVRGHEGRPVAAEIVGRSGDDIRVYLEPGFDRYQYGVKPGQTFLDKIRDEKFDIVALQAVCGFIMNDQKSESGENAHAAAITGYCEAIRAAGGEPLFYEMGWGRGEREAEGRRRILDLARTNGVRLYAPCSTAWARVYEERPDLRLQHPKDASHPGDLGHFLNLACFYSALTGRSPEGKLPRTIHVWPHLSKEEKESRRAELDAAYARFTPDEYQSRLPEWMRRNAGSGQTATISEEDARFLEGIAWQAYQATQKKLGLKR
jgi:hypothetical protein